MTRSALRRSGSATRGEKAREQVGGLAFADSTVDFRRVMAGWRGVKPDAVLDCSALRVASPEIEPADARERNGGRAHRAWLKRHVEIAIDQALRAELRGGFANDQYFGMCRGITQFEGSISGPGEHISIAHDDRSHGHFAPRGGGARLVERQ